MKKFDMYICRIFIKSSLVGTLGFLTIFVMRELFKIVDYLRDDKLNVAGAFEMFFVALPYYIVQVIPLGILIGSLMTANGLASNLEITAMKTSGISFRRIIRYPIMISILVSFFTLWFGDRVVPRANRKKREMRYSKVYNVKDSRIKQDVFLKGEGSYIYYIRFVNGEKRSINNAEIIILSEDMSTLKKIVTIEKGRYSDELKKWTMKNVVINDVITGKISKSDNYIPDFIKETPDDFLRDRVREKEMNMENIRESVTFIKKTGGSTRKLLVTFYKRWASPFAVIIMSFIGFSLGSRYVRGASAVSIGLSVLIGYTYYIVMVTMDALGVGGYISPLIGAWIPNVLFLTLGAYTMDQAEY